MCNFCFFNYKLFLIFNVFSLFAVCLDGSPPAYHLHRGSGTGINSWLVHLEVATLAISYRIFYYSELCLIFVYVKFYIILIKKSNCSFSFFCCYYCIIFLVIRLCFSFDFTIFESFDSILEVQILFD